MSLLTKLFKSNNTNYTLTEEAKAQLVKVSGSKAKKGILALVVAGVMSLSLTACAPKTSQTNPNPNPGPGTIVKPEPGENDYSSIMLDVLTDSTYQQLIQKKLNGTITKNEQSPIPYNFLSKRGHDINKIKSDALSCEVDVYTKANDTTTLYLSVKVENSNNSITNYMLTYPLTEQEFEEYKMLHKDRYIQSPYYIQELDNQKTANIVSAISINKQSYENLNEVIMDAYHRLFDVSTIEIDLTDFVSATDFTVLARENIYSNQEIRTIKQRKFDLHFYPAASATINNNIISIGNAQSCSSTNNEELLNSYENLTYFTPYSFTVNNIYSKNV